MTETIECELHGEQERAFVCNHLSEDMHGLGFNISEETESAFPDAWCNDCEVIRASQGSWTDEAQALVPIRLICSSCYRKSRVRNTLPLVTLNDLEPMRWKCGSCDSVHTGPCLDFGFGSPYYWVEESEHSHCNEDFCLIDNTDYFVRGVIELPIIGTDQYFRWGVWGSLSKDNFQQVLELPDETTAESVPAMFSWLSSQIEGYPDTLSLKMHAHLRNKLRPSFELEPSDHPLSKQQLDGIYPSQVRDIMLSRLLPE